MLILLNICFVNAISLDDTLVTSNGLNSTINITFPIIFDKLEVFNNAITFTNLAYTNPSSCDLKESSYSIYNYTDINKVTELPSEACPPSTLTPTSSGGSAIFKPTQKQLKEGYAKILTKKQKVQINLSNDNEKYIAEIKEVNKTLEKVIVSVDGNNYSINNGSSEKIDLNNDGYYDLEISVIQIYETGYAKMEFKEIHEEIPREDKEAITESVVDNNEDVVSNKNKLIYYVLGFVVLILIVSVLFRKLKRKKRHRKFGY